MVKFMREGIFTTYGKHLILKSLYISIFVWLTIIFLDFLITFVMELENLVDYRNIFSLFSAVLMEQPHKGLDYLESSVLIGTLISLSIFNQQGNLIFLRSSGFSPAKIVLMAGMGPLILAFTIIAMDELLFINMSKSASLNEIHTQEELITSSDSLTWQLEDLSLIGANFKDEKNLENIQVIKFDEQGRVVSANQFIKGRYQDGNIIIDNLNQNNDQIVLSFNPASNISSQKLDRLTISSLYQLKGDYLSTGYDKDSQLIMSAIYSKILLPFSVIAIIFLAGSLMFGFVRSGGVGRQIVIGIFIGLIYDLLKDLSIASFITYQWPILFAYLLPIIVLFGSGAILYKRI